VSEDTARELMIERIIYAPPALVFRAWTDPDLIVQWFTPPPWSTASATIDLRVGGESLIVMRDPEGNLHPNPGVFLHVDAPHRLISTDAFLAGWLPSSQAFMTLDLSFTPVEQGTHYRAVVRHWSAEDRANHEQMGFYAGWGRTTEQLAELCERLAEV
jgi:uncharacterized protein YndB with AHSA1/START domain